MEFNLEFPYAANLKKAKIFFWIVLAGFLLAIAMTVLATLQPTQNSFEDYMIGLPTIVAMLFAP